MGVWRLLLAGQGMCCDHTWMQSFLSTHQWVWPDDVDKTPRAASHFVHQKGQIVELVLDRNTMIRDQLENVFACSCSFSGFRTCLKVLPAVPGSEFPAGAAGWWLRCSGPPARGRDAPRRRSGSCLQSGNTNQTHTHTHTGTCVCGFFTGLVLKYNSFYKFSHSFVTLELFPSS